MSVFCRPTPSFGKIANIFDVLLGLLQPDKASRLVIPTLNVRKLRFREVTKMINVTVLVFWSCCTEVPQTW